MGDSLENFYAFVKQPIAFRCKPPGRNPDPAATHIAHVRHILRPPATADSLQILRTMLGQYAVSFEKFYSKHEGFVLYRDLKSPTAGIEAFSIQNWERATKHLLEENDECSEESDPAQILSGVAFARVPKSGNYFVVPLNGSSAGKIFYADHDGWYSDAFAESFDGFLNRITKDPVKLLAKDLGCYTRYSDGSTGTQWIPAEVVSEL